MVEKKKCVIVGVLLFLIIAALVGVLCAIFIPKLLQKPRTPAIIVRPGKIYKIKVFLINDFV